MSTGSAAGIHYVAHPPGDGLGEAAAGYIDLLRDAGVPVGWTPLAWGPHGLTPCADVPSPGRHRVVIGAPAGDTVVLHTLLPWLDRLREQLPARRHLALATWEADRLDPSIVASLNRLDGVIVPSAFNREVFVGSGVEVPVSVVPHVHQPARPCPGGIPGVPDGAFVFYLIATWSTRKAVPETIVAFLDEFGPDEDVALVVKTTRHDAMAVERRTRAGEPPGRTEETWWSLARLVAGRRTPPVHLLAGDLPDEHIRRLHTRGDCLLSITRSEGFGLTPFEAGAHGNPTIATGFGATPEVLPPGYPLLVDHELVATIDEEPDGWIDLSAEQRWARPDFGHARALMRWAFEHRDQAAAIGDRVRRHVSGRYRAEVVGRSLRLALDG